MVIRYETRNTIIPQELREHRHWTRCNSKKIPIDLDGIAMKWGDPANWLLFEQIARFERIGIILDPKATGIIPIDVDGCRDKDTGFIHPLVMGWIRAAHTYAEISPSETGVKFYLKGILPDYLKEIEVTDVPWRVSPEQKHVSIEIYAGRHFFTITGNIVPGCPHEINAAPELLNELLIRFAPPPKSKERQTDTFDFDRWSRRHLDIVEDTPDGSIIRCPWSSTHSTPGDTARVWAGPPHTFYCFHAHCKGRTWKDVREYYEPDAYANKQQWQEYRPGAATPTNGHTPQEIDLCQFSADDAGNSDALNALYGEDFLYCSSIGWMHYEETHWRIDTDGAIVRGYAIETLRRRRHAAIDAEKEQIVGCTKSDERRVNGCVNLFKIHVHISIEQFDRDPDLLNCKNGVVDLRTGQITAHTRLQRFTYCLPVDYRQSDILEWLNFLNGVVGGGQEVIDYLQLALGYSLTGHTREEILFYLYGPPRAGKGTLAETFLALLPRPIAAMVDFSSFTAKREGDVSNFDLAPLKPSRMIFASESNRGQALNPAKIKQLTGGDYITCCYKHRDFFSYRPQFKVWMMSNHPVNGDPEDDALWSRVRVIEFPNSYLGVEDKSKKARMKEPEVLEMALWWAVQGGIKWYALGSRGLVTPHAVARVTQEQRDEQDYVQQWLEACSDDDAEGWVSNEQIMSSHTTWCENNNIRPKGPKGISLSLKAKGYNIGVVRKIEGKTIKGVEGLHLYPIEQEG